MCSSSIWSQFNVDGYLESSDFDCCKVWHKGEPRRDGHHEGSGFNIDVCDVESGGLKEQTQKAIAFLSDNYTELRKLMEFSGVEIGVLDFAIAKRNVMAQFDRFSTELVRLAGSLGLEIALLQYAVSDYDE